MYSRFFCVILPDKSVGAQLKAKDFWSRISSQLDGDESRHLRISIHKYLVGCALKEKQEYIKMYPCFFYVWFSLIKQLP